MHPIGFLDSGVGGLTILNAVHKTLPAYDTLYFGDSAHAPYGDKDQETLYELVSAGTTWLFEQGCPLVIYACNTASAIILRRIQQELLPKYPGKKVLGIIRPTIEELARVNHKQILILATPATVASAAYEKELAKINPAINITSHACPTWGPLVEQGKANTPYGEAEVAREMAAANAKSNHYDAVLLACTHYPYLSQHIQQHTPKGVGIYDQGELVAASLHNYLKHHPEIESQLSKQKSHQYAVTGDPLLANQLAMNAFGYHADFTQAHLQ